MLIKQEYTIINTALYNIKNKLMFDNEMSGLKSLGVPYFRDHLVYFSLVASKNKTDRKRLSSAIADYYLRALCDEFYGFGASNKLTAFHNWFEQLGGV